MALKALRDKKRPRILWIDALCINQSDIEERSSQVAFMSSVYSRAVRVIVWLGESGKDIAKLFDFLNDTKGKWRQAYCRIPQSGPLSNARRNLRSLLWKRTLSGARFERSFGQFCHDPYWRCVWIIQEILSASSVVILCGSKLLDMNYLAAASSAADRGFQDWAGFFLAKQYTRHCSTGETQRSLSELLTLCKTCNSQCEDSRDKIYGLLSLANDNTNLVPDYSKSKLLCIFISN